MHNNVDIHRHEEKQISDYFHVLVLLLLQILDRCLLLLEKKKFKKMMK
jgi:hypothetical protein